MFRRSLFHIVSLVLTVTIFFSSAIPTSAASLSQRLPNATNTINAIQLTGGIEPLGSTKGLGKALSPEQYYGRQRLVKECDPRLVRIYDNLSEGINKLDYYIKLDKEYLDFEPMPGIPWSVTVDVDITETAILGGSYTDENLVKYPDEYIKVLDYYLWDHPEVFWFANSCKLIYTYYTDEQGTYRDVHLFFELPMKRAEITAKQNQLKEYVSDVLFDIKLDRNMTDYEREKFIFKILHNSFTLDNTFERDTMANVLIDGRGGSKGFSRAFQYLMQQCGIQCIPVSGMYNGTSRTWCMVQFGSDWYAVDVCQNMPFRVIDASESAYFNTSNSFMTLKGYTVTSERTLAYIPNI